MVAVRRFLALLIIVGLAIAPVTVVFAQGDAPASMAMEDCDHGLAIPPTKNHEQQKKKHCPGCDHDGQCTPVGCLSACLQHFAIIGEIERPMTRASAHITPILSMIRTGLGFQPQPPPPRT